MFQYADLATRRTFVNSAHCAHSDFFFEPDPNNERDIDALVVGAVSATYPLRTRWINLVKQGKIPGGVIRSHPGYFSM